MSVTLEEIQASDWYKNRPKIIQKAIDKRPPGIYIVKETGHSCILLSYEEPESEKFEDVTVTVQITTGLFAPRNVFGYKLEDVNPSTVKSDSSPDTSES